ncbi:MAG TPA: hypothetical protein VG711_08095 [Phycisphaerales bacterium]|nr:hypothetical protein [Phycisphaerales bacterium]
MSTTIISVLIALLYMAVQVLPRLLAYQAKKQEQEKRRQAAAGLNRGQFNAPPTRPGAQSQLPPARTLPTARNPAADLAARRQAQLEQLRQRRDQRKSAPLASPFPQGSARGNMSMKPIPPIGRQVNPARSGIQPVAKAPPSQPPRGVPARPQPGRFQVSTRPPEQVRRAPSQASPGISRVELEDQRHLEAKRREAAERVLIVQEEKDEVLMAARRRALEDKARLQEMKAAAAVSAARAVEESPITAQQLRNIFSDHRQIRAAFVLREVLDVPRGLASPY